MVWWADGRRAVCGKNTCTLQFVGAVWTPGAPLHPCPVRVAKCPDSLGSTPTPKRSCSGAAVVTLGPSSTHQAPGHRVHPKPDLAISKGAQVSYCSLSQLSQTCGYSCITNSSLRILYPSIPCHSCPTDNSWRMRSPRSGHGS